MANALVYGGMLIGSVLAWFLATAGIDARGTFLRDGVRSRLRLSLVALARSPTPFSGS